MIVFHPMLFFLMDSLALLCPPLPQWLLIDGEEWVPASTWQRGGWSYCCYISAHRLRGLPTLYPSPAIKGHLRGDCVSFCASQFCLEKCFLLCLVVRPLLLLFKCTFPLFCSLGIWKVCGYLISIQGRDLDGGLMVYTGALYGSK